MDKIMEFLPFLIPLVIAEFALLGYPGCGANEAIERLVNLWQVPLLRLCYIQLHDQNLAEDGQFVLS